MKLSEISEKLKQVDEAKEEIIDVLGPRFAEIKAQAEATFNDAQREFKETDETLANIMQSASEKFDGIVKMIGEAEIKYNEVNDKMEILYKEANNKFQNVE